MFVCVCVRLDTVANSRPLIVLSVLPFVLHMCVCVCVCVLQTIHRVVCELCVCVCVLQTIHCVVCTFVCSDTVAYSIIHVCVCVYVCVCASGAHSRPFIVLSAATW